VLYNQVPEFYLFYINVIVESSGWFAAGGLEKGKEYEFRVKAKNRAGLGEPSQPSETVTPKAKASTYIRTFCFVFMMFSNFLWLVHTGVEVEVDRMSSSAKYRRQLFDVKNSTATFCRLDATMDETLDLQP